MSTIMHEVVSLELGALENLITQGQNTVEAGKLDFTLTDMMHGISILL